MPAEVSTRRGRPRRNQDRNADIFDQFEGIGEYEGQGKASAKNLARQYRMGLRNVYYVIAQERKRRSKD